MTRRSLLRAAACTGVLTWATLLAPPAHAADEINIDHVEVADDRTVSVLLAVDRLPGSATPDPDSITVSVDGEWVEVTAERVAAGQIQRTTVLALDASFSMKGRPIKDAKVAAKAFLDAAPADVRIGLLTFSGEVQDVIAPTTDRGALVSAIDAMALTAGTRVYDAVMEAVDVAGGDGARSVLVLSDGKDQGGGAALADAVAAATDSDVVVDVVALGQTREDRALLAQVSGASGGSVIQAEDPASLTAVFTAQADALSSQILVRFPQPEQADGEVNLAVSLAAGESTYEDTAFVPLARVAESGPTSVEHATPLVSKNMALGGVVALGLASAVILGLLLVGQRGPSPSQQRLATYLGEASSGSAKGKRAGTPAPSSLKDSAVALTRTMVRGDFETRLAQRLGAAGMTLTAAEWLLLHTGIAISAGIAGLVLGGGLLMVILLLTGAALPWLYLKFKHSRRLAAFGAQLAETLTLIAGGLSAGLSLPQAVDTVVREGQQPMAGELRRTLVEQRLGVEIEDALEGVGARMQSADFGWVVMAIRIQREVGGNLAEILNTVADTLREREYLRRQVKSLSAEGRLSGWILGSMPPAIFVFLLFTNPDYVRPLYTEPMGWVLTAAALTLLGIGSFAMSRLSKVEV